MSAHKSSGNKSKASCKIKQNNKLTAKVNGEKAKSNHCTPLSPTNAKTIWNTMLQELGKRCVAPGLSFIKWNCSCCCSKQMDRSVNEMDTVQRARWPSRQMFSRKDTRGNILYFGLLWSNTLLWMYKESYSGPQPTANLKRRVPSRYAVVQEEAVGWTIPTKKKIYDPFIENNIFSAPHFCNSSPIHVRYSCYDMSYFRNSHGWNVIHVCHNRLCKMWYWFLYASIFFSSMNENSVIPKFNWRLKEKIIAVQEMLFCHVTFEYPPAAFDD